MEHQRRKDFIKRKEVEGQKIEQMFIIDDIKVVGIMALLTVGIYHVFVGVFL